MTMNTDQIQNHLEQLGSDWCALDRKTVSSEDVIISDLIKMAVALCNRVRELESRESVRSVEASIRALSHRLQKLEKSEFVGLPVMNAP